MKVYLDNNATTLVLPQVKKVMEPFYSEAFANPSSPYDSGAKVRRQIEEARQFIAQILGVKSEREIVFTSGGTESNNTAIRSALKSFPNKKTIVTSAVEHSSVKNLCERLSTEGYRIISVGVSKSGSLNWDELIASLNDDVAIVSIMWANNETGVLFPVEKIGEELKQRNILFHIDAVQAVGKIIMDLSQIHVDYVTFSAHKIHGPKGIGGLYVRDGSPFHALIVGGRQERDRRAGTENTAGIVGLSVALEHSKFSKSEQIAQLRDRFENELTQKIPGSLINGQNEPRISNTTSITIPGIEAETFLVRLSQLGIEASSGSACLTGAFEPSHVLMAMGHSPELASSSVRFSLSRFTTDAEIDYALSTIPKLVKELRHLSERPAAAR